MDDINDTPKSKTTHKNSSSENLLPKPFGSLASIHNTQALMDVIKSVGRLPFPEMKNNFDGNSEKSLNENEKIKTGSQQRYTLVNKIAKGGMSVVYNAFDNDLKRDVAIKICLKSDAKERLRLIEEAQVTGQLEHPGIIPVHEIGLAEDGNFFFAMKLVNGKSLKEVLDEIRQNPQNHIPEYSLNSLLLAFISVCNAVAFAHAKGVLHRDLKPANIMIGKFGEVLVMDWGLAKVKGAPEINNIVVRDSSNNQDKDESSNIFHSGESSVRGLREDTGVELTMDGAVIGTPAYMPPEQARGKLDEIDEQSDVYSLGAILYEILTLKRPAEGDNFAELMAAVINGCIVPPHVCKPDVPVDLSAISLKALASKKKFRYESVNDLRNDILRYLEGRSVSAHEDSAFETFVKFVKRNKAISIAVAAVFIITVIALGITLRERKLTEKAFSNYKIEQKAREALIAQDFYERQRQWVCIFSENFLDSAVRKRWEVSFGAFNIDKNHPGYSNRIIPLNIKNGKLHLKDGLPQCLTLSVPIRGDCAIEFDCMQPGDYRNDMSCFIGAMGSAESEYMPYTGYLFQVGGFDNSRNLIRKADVILWQEYSAPIDKGKLYRIRAERVGQQLRLLVNGDTVASITDPRPLYGADHARIGIYGYRAETVYGSIKVYKMGVPLKDDLLEVARYNLKQGNFETARDLFEEISTASVDVLRREAATLELSKTHKLLAMKNDVPKYKALLSSKWKIENPSIGVMDNGLYLDLTMNIPTNLDISIIQGLPFSHIDMSNIMLSTIEPLRGMPLNYLVIQNSPQLASLEPLRGMALENVNIRGCTQVTELDPIVNPSLRKLDAGQTNITNLSPLQGSALRVLELANNYITDISPLQGLPLEELALPNCAVTDLTPLRGMPLQSLGVGRNKELSDIAPLKNSPLAKLFAGGTQISSIEPLSKTKLVALDICETPIADIEVLKDMPLTVFNAAGTKINNLNSLRNKKLTIVNVNNTNVLDISPLRGLPIDHLGVFGIPLTESNVAAIMSMPLVSLSLDFRLDTQRSMQCLSLKTLGFINGFVKGYALKFIDVIKSPDNVKEVAKNLYTMSSLINGRRVVCVPLLLTIDDAEVWCAKHGGKLYVPAHKKEFVQVFDFLTANTEMGTILSLTMSLDPINREVVWGNGTKFDDHWAQQSDKTEADKTGRISFVTASEFWVSAMGKNEKACFILELLKK